MLRNQLKTPHFTPIICALLAAAVTVGCATAHTRREYKNKSEKSYPSGEAMSADDPIDRYAAFAQHFKLEKDAETITVGITAEYVADITGAKKTKKTYFIVEKLIDMSRFANSPRKQMYAEIGRNYDADWNREKELTLTSSKSDHFRKLDAASTYRIRYTTFSGDPVDFTITIQADCAITYIDKNK